MRFCFILYPDDGGKMFLWNQTTRIHISPESNLHGRTNLLKDLLNICRSQWPRDRRRRSTAARLLRSWVRIPPGAWMFVCCECYVLLGRGLCDELITRPEESYRLWCVVVCDQETSRMRRPYSRWAAAPHEKKYIYICYFESVSHWPLLIYDVAFVTLLPGYPLSCPHLLKITLLYITLNYPPITVQCISHQL